MQGYLGPNNTRAFILVNNTLFTRITTSILYLSYTSLHMQILCIMQQKGTCKQNPKGACYQKTILDKRLKIITLCDTTVTHMGIAHHY